LSHSTVAMGVHSNSTGEFFGLDGKGHGIFSEQAVGGHWGPWASFGPEGSAKAITVAADSSKLLHVMVVMTDGSIQEQSEYALNQWGAWQLFAPASTAKVLALGQDRLGDLEAYAVTPGGHLISRKQLAPGGSWTGWATVNLPGIVQSVAATRKVDGYLDVMAVLRDGSVEWEDEDETGFRPWVKLGPPGTAVELSMGQNAGGGLTVYALTPDGTISNKSQQNDPGYPWSAWGPVPGLPCAAASVNVTAVYQQQLFVAAICADGTMRYLREAEPNGNWVGGWDVFGPAGEFGVDSSAP
jgi:hypothetical protein